MLIHVTQEHIDTGRRYKMGNCPVALALRDYFKPDDCSVLADVDKIRINNVEYTTPLEVANFIFRFDRNCTAYPFSFSLQYLCARTACNNKANGYRIWNNPTFFPAYRDYCVSCGRKIVDFNAGEEIKLEYRKLLSKSAPQS